MNDSSIFISTESSAMNNISTYFRNRYFRFDTITFVLNFDEIQSENNRLNLISYFMLLFWYRNSNVIYWYIVHAIIILLEWFYWERTKMPIFHNNFYSICCSSLFLPIFTYYSILLKNRTLDALWRRNWILFSHKFIVEMWFGLSW